MWSACCGRYWWSCSWGNHLEEDWWRMEKYLKQVIGVDLQHLKRNDDWCEHMQQSTGRAFQILFEWKHSVYHGVRGEWWQVWVQGYTNVSTAKARIFKTHSYWTKFFWTHIVTLDQVTRSGCLNKIGGMQWDTLFLQCIMIIVYDTGCSSRVCFIRMTHSWFSFLCIPVSPSKKKLRTLKMSSRTPHDVGEKSWGKVRRW